LKAVSFDGVQRLSVYEVVAFEKRQFQLTAKAK
jgi:hypothetical protein